MFLCQKLPPGVVLKATVEFCKQNIESCRAYARLRENAQPQSCRCNEARENFKVSRAPSTASGPPSRFGSVTLGL